jgi:carbon storage regulator CsrA
MLVLSRRTGEAVVVGTAGGFEHLLKVTVLEFTGATVRLGFEVDKSVPVHRWEVWEKIQAAGAHDGPSPGPDVRDRSMRTCLPNSHEQSGGKNRPSGRLHSSNDSRGELS